MRYEEHLQRKGNDGGKSSKRICEHQDYVYSPPDRVQYSVKNGFFFFKAIDLPPQQTDRQTDKMENQCEHCKEKIDEVFLSEDIELCFECFEKNEKEHTFTCDVCEWKHDERYNYAGCCNDGDCKFGREKMCYDCCEVDEETGVPVCFDCIKAKTKKRRTIRVPLCRLSE